MAETVGTPANSPDCPEQYQKKKQNDSNSRAPEAVPTKENTATEETLAIAATAMTQATCQKQKGRLQLSSPPFSLLVQYISAYLESGNQIKGIL
jgi:hypothetical protein